MTPQKVVCTDCGFREVVGPADEETAAEYVLAHGKATGHQLRLQTIPDESTKEEV